MSAGLGQLNQRWPEQTRFHNTDQICCDLWSDKLQQDIIELILERLGALDRICFGAVCTSWRAAVARSMATPALYFPFVLHAARHRDDAHWFSSLDEIEKRRCSLNPLYEKGTRIVGVIEGRWLIIQNHSGWFPGSSCKTLSTHFILNPITQKQFMLPPQSTISGTYGNHPSFFHRMVASSEPTTSNCLVAGLSTSGFLLAFCRLTDSKWTLINAEDEIRYLLFQDIIFCDGKLYASTGHFRKFVIAFDLRQKNKNGIYKAHKIEMEVPLLISHRSFVSYASLAVDLVSKDLLLIICDIELLSHKRETFDDRNVEKSEVVCLSVYKMSKGGDQNQWIEVTDLDDRILFYGNVGSFFMPTKVFGESTHKGNCIYYAFRIKEDCCDVGKFCLNDKTIIRYQTKRGNACGWFLATTN